MNLTLDLLIVRTTTTLQISVKILHSNHSLLRCFTLHPKQDSKKTTCTSFSFKLCTKHRLQIQNPQVKCIMFLLCTLASAQGSKLNYSEVLQCKFPTEQRDSLQLLHSRFITQTEITHLSLSQQCTVHLNTIICLVIQHLSASKLPYFSCGRQVSFSEKAFT